MIQRIYLKNGSSIYVDETGEQISAYGESALTKIKQKFEMDDSIYWAVVKAMSKMKDMSPILISTKYGIPKI